MPRKIMFCLLVCLFSFVTKEALATDNFIDVYHVVEPGQNAYRIALLYKIPLQELADNNGLGHDYVIEVGEVLFIKRIALVADESTSDIHVVKAGETVYSIAKMHGISEDELRRLNGIGDDNIIEVGKQLFIRQKEVELVATRRKPVKIEPEIETWASNNDIRLLPNKCAPYRAYMERAAEKYGFKWPALAAIAGNESSCNPSAVGKLEELGMYQFLPTTAEAIIKEYGLSGINLLDPEDATELAAIHFSGLLKEFKGDYQRAYIAWNMGKKRAREFRNPMELTYAKRVEFISRLFRS